MTTTRAPSVPAVLSADSVPAPYERVIAAAL
jgi:hypothetical protein